MACKKILPNIERREKMKELNGIVAEMIIRDSQSVKSSKPDLEKQAKRSKLLGNTNGKYPDWNREIPYPGRGGIIGEINLTSVDYRIPQELFRDPMIVM